MSLALQGALQDGCCNGVVSSDVAKQGRGGVGARAVVERRKEEAVRETPSSHTGVIHETLATCSRANEYRAASF